MTKRQKINLVVVIAISMIFSMAHRVIAESNLSGKWKINKEKVRGNPRQTFRELRKNEDKAPDKDGTASSERQDSSNVKPEKVDKRLLGQKKAYEEITIQYNPPEFKIIDKEGKERIFWTDGRERQLEGPNGMKSSAKAKVSGNQIILELVTPDRNILTESYHVTQNDDRLHIRIRLKTVRPEDATSILRLYDRISSP